MILCVSSCNDLSLPPLLHVCRFQDYNNLCQCESLEDVKLNLQETDYDQFLSQENKVTPAALQDRATKKLVSLVVCFLVENILQVQYSGTFS